MKTIGDELATRIQMAVGQASMCWGEDDNGESVFQDREAADVADQLGDYVDGLFREFVAWAKQHSGPLGEPAECICGQVHVEDAVKAFLEQET